MDTADGLLISASQIDAFAYLFKNLPGDGLKTNQQPDTAAAGQPNPRARDLPQSLRTIEPPIFSSKGSWLQKAVWKIRHLRQYYHLQK